MIVKVFVKTNQSSQSIVEEEGALKVSLISKPVKGRANTELVKLLEKFYNKRVRLVSGASSKLKRFEVL